MLAVPRLVVPRRMAGSFQYQVLSGRRASSASTSFVAPRLPSRATLPLSSTSSSSIRPHLLTGSTRSLLDRTLIAVPSRSFSVSPLRKAETTNLEHDPHTSSSSSSTSNNNNNNNSSSNGNNGKSESLSQRLKTLFRTHGWSALSIYLLLSAIDFSLTFLLIYAVGADKVRAAEDYVLDALGWRRKDTGEPGKLKVGFEDWKERHPGAGKVVDGARRKLSHHDEEKKVKEGENGLVTSVTGVGGASKKDSDGYSAIATTAVLAYAIHKTLLLPVRVGVTVAITPRVVRTLQSWGWNVGMAKSGAATIRSKATAGAAATASKK